MIKKTYKNAIECVKKHDLENAESLFESLLKDSDKEHPSPYKEYPNIYRWLGVTYFERHNYDKAEEYYRDALAKTNYDLAKTNDENSKKFSEFGSKLGLVANEDKNALAWINHDLGLILINRRHYLDAECKLKLAIKQIEDKSDELSSWFLNDLGYLYYIWQKYSEAIEQYDKIIERDKKNNKKLDEKNGYAEIYRGAALYRKEDLNKAEETFNDALIIFNAKINQVKDQTSESLSDYKLAKASINNSLARIHIKRELYKEAEAEIEEALKLYDDQSKYIESCTPNKSKAEKELKTALLINRGILYYNKDENDKAKEQFQEAIKYSESIYSPSYLAYYNLANTYAKEDETETAKDYYEHALKIKPDGKEAKEAIEKLGKKEKNDWWDWWFKPFTCKWTIPYFKKDIKRPRFKSILGLILIVVMLSSISSLVLPSFWTPALNATNTKYTEENVIKSNSSPQTKGIQKNTTTTTTRETNPIGLETRLLCAALRGFL